MQGADSEMIVSNGAEERLMSIPAVGEVGLQRLHLFARDDVARSVREVELEASSHY